MSFQKIELVLILHSCLLYTATVGQWRDGDLRLVGGSYQWEGRVEIYFSGSWGTITDSNWTNDDATVACRKMGHFRPGATGYAGAYFGQGSGPIHLDHVMCSWSEYSLTDCETGEGTRQTSHQEDVGVKCNTINQSYRDLDIRLVGGPFNWEGRVEIFWSGSWFSVMDRTWYSEDAQVVCRQLGFPEEDAQALCCGQYGEGTGSLQFRVSCSGDETNITECYPRLRQGYYPQDNAGVMCGQGGDYKEGDIRLVGGNYSWEGRVEIYRGGEWGTVTDDSADERDAHVVCRQLGYDTRYGYRDISLIWAYYGEGSGPIHMNWLYCTGDEYRLVDCEHDPSYYDHNEDWSVSCKNDVPVYGELSLDRGPTISDSYDGALHIWLNDEWSSVSNSSWTTENGEVVCRQLGYLSYEDYYYSYNTANFPIAMSDVQCSGDELKLVDCSYNTGGATPVVSVTCLHLYDDSCINERMRLTGGDNTYEGRVEVCTSRNQWGTVCNKQWSSDYTAIVCQYMGYSDEEGSFESSHSFGGDVIPIAMDFVNCTGSEILLEECAHFTHSYGCDHEDDAGVRCQPVQCEDGEVKLTADQSFSDRSGVAIEGYVAVCTDKRWNAVCNSRGQANAITVCSQLGYAEGEELQPYNGARAYHTYIEYLRCSGDEDRVFDCSYEEASHSSTCSQSLAVSCSLANCLDGEVRLMGEEVEWEGRLEVCFSRRWGTVSGDGWTEAESTVVCNDLGYDTVGVYDSARPATDSMPVYMENVRCMNEELNLLDCSYNSNSPNKQHSKDVGVECKDSSCSDGDLRLFGGDSEHNGLLQVCLGRRWGTINGDGWSASDTRVACRQLGFETVGDHVTVLVAKVLSAPIHMDNVACYGSESRLTDCTYHTDTSEDSHSQDIWIDCSSPTAESQSSSSSDGAVDSSLAVALIALLIAVLVILVLIGYILCRKRGPIRRVLHRKSSHRAGDLIDQKMENPLQVSLTKKDPSSTYETTQSSPTVPPPAAYQPLKISTLEKDAEYAKPSTSTGEKRKPKKVPPVPAKKAHNVRSASGAAGGDEIIYDVCV